MKRKKFLKIAAVAAAGVSMPFQRASAQDVKREKLLAKKRGILGYLKAVAASDKYLSGQRFQPEERHRKEWAKFAELGCPLPAVMGAEYCRFIGLRDFPDAQSAMMWREMNDEILSHWKKGGFATINCHFPNPYNEKYNGLRQKVADGGEAVCAEGGPVRVRWLALVDEVAMGIKDLNAAGVVPELRPLHESNGKWFWYGATLPAKVQQKLEDDIYEKIEGAGCVVIWHKSWGMAPDMPRISKPDRYDIVGCDTYNNNALDLSSVSEIYGETLAAGKLFMISEFGARNYRKPTPVYDCMEIVRQMDKNCPRSIGSLWWSGVMGMQENKNAKEYMASPRIIALGEVDCGIER